MGSILIKQQTEKVKVIATPTWTKHVPNHTASQSQISMSEQKITQ